jgi:hypothetical protein
LQLTPNDTCWSRIVIPVLAFSVVMLAVPAWAADPPPAAKAPRAKAAPQAPAKKAAVGKDEPLRCDKLKDKAQDECLERARARIAEVSQQNRANQQAGKDQVKPAKPQAPAAAPAKSKPVDAPPPSSVPKSGEASQDLPGKPAKPAAAPSETVGDQKKQKGPPQTEKK